MKLLDENNIEWAFNHIRSFYDSDFFPNAFEFEAIKCNWNQVRTYISGIDLEKYTPKSPQMLLAPKLNDNYRIVHRLDPIDSIIYTAMTYEVSAKIEDFRIPSERKIVFSYRIEPNIKGSLFAKNSTFRMFLNKAKELAEGQEINYVIKADITDFYNQIYTHRISNLISEAGRGEYELEAKIIENFILGLNKKTSKGIPIGPTASILLSELVLADIDKRILSHTDKFVRYVDDIYIFVENKGKALKILHDLTSYLYSPHRLVLNNSKTKIITKKEFLEKHYRDEEYEEKLIKKATISERVDKILEEIIKEEIGLMAPYEDTILTPELSELYETVEKKEKLKILSKVYKNMVDNILDKKEIDYSMLRHVIKKARRYKIRSISAILIRNFENLIPVMREFIIYLISVSNDKFLQNNISKLEKMWDSDYINLPYINTWLSYYWYKKDISRFSQKIDYKNILSIRDRALFARSIKDTGWIRTYRDNVETLGPWDKRAVIYASSILPKNEMRPWAESVTATGDIIDRSIFIDLVST